MANKRCPTAWHSAPRTNPAAAAPGPRVTLPRVRELQEGDANERHTEVTKRRVLRGTEDNR